MASDPGQGSSTAGEAADREDSNPWPFLEDFFSFLSSSKSQTNNYMNLKYQCKLCPGAGGKLSAQSNGFSNLKKHMERKHPGKMKDFEELLKTRQRSRNSSGSQVQSSIKAFCGSHGQVTQRVVNTKIAAFVVKTGQAFTIVRQEAFKDLVETLQPGKKTPSYQSLMHIITETFQGMNEEIKDHLSSAKYVCTTADVWTRGNRSFLGVTAHTLDDNLERTSFAIACRRMHERHTYDVLAEMLEGIHTEYQIQYKVVGTVTDNGTNFCKAFSTFGEVELLHGAQEEDEEEDVEFEEVDTVLSNPDEASLHSLPAHHRCAAHTLNLISTTDVERDTKHHPGFTKLSRAAFAKCQALWNKQGRSEQFALLVESKYQLLFVVPNSTRWNSVYDSMSRLNRMLGMSTDNMNFLLSKVDARPFSSVEIAFIGEYCEMMKPFAQALDILQGDKNMFLGYLLPTVVRLKEKIRNRVEASVHCKPLGGALLKGLDTRFEQLFEARRAVLAAVTLPMFKQGWLTIEGQERARRWLQEEMKAFEATPEDADENQDEDSFFPKRRRVSSTPEEELSRYYSDPSNDLSSLSAYPLVREVCQKFNTVFPSSASCERMFSHGKFLFRPNRLSLKDSNLEMQLLMHVNNAWK